jgi:hypothetical protein
MRILLQFLGIFALGLTVVIASAVWLQSWQTAPTAVHEGVVAGSYRPDVADKGSYWTGRRPAEMN